MHEPTNRDILLVELEKERSIRRTVKLLCAKRNIILDDLDRLISHLSLLVNIPPETDQEVNLESEVLLEAAKRIDDPIFTDLLTRIIEEKQK